MNIVDLIKDQISGDVMASLRSMLGKDQAATTKATTGAVPALLSVLASLIKTPGGVEKLITALRTFDTHSLADIVASLRTGNTTNVQQKGDHLLSSLLGGGTLALIVSALAKFANIDAGSSKSLLSALSPLILSAIASHFKGKTIDSHSVTDFFSDQANNISAAVPGELSIPQLPGAGGITSPAVEAPSGIPSWIYAVVGLAVLALLGWYLYSQGPDGPRPPEPEPIPEVTTAPAAKPVDVPTLAPDSIIVDMPNQLSKVYTDAIEALTTVQDVPTAEAATPKLKGLDATLDKLKPLIDKLPDSAKTAIAEVQTKYLTQVKDLIAKVLAIPGVSEKLKPIVDGLVSKLSDIK